VKRSEKLRREGMRFVRAVRRFGEEVLALRFDGSFEKFSPEHPTANWLYVVRADRLESALRSGATFKFSWDGRKARRWRRYHAGRGRHTYLYSAEAHGGSNCPVTPSLLAAGRARCCYVVLHEGWHSTLRLEGVRMPYALEEATGRVVGVYGASLFAESVADAGLLRETRAQRKAWAAFARFVNAACRRLERLYARDATRRERRSEFQRLRAEAAALRGRMPASWEREELSRPLNNAFFFRYRDYTLHYPLAVKVYRAAGSLREAMEAYRRAGREGALSMLGRIARSAGA